MSCRTICSSSWCSLRWSRRRASDARALRDEKAKLLRAIRSFDSEYGARPVRRITRRGGRGGRLEGRDVRRRPRVHRQLALVRRPFYICAGKKLGATVTEVLVEFRRPPEPLFHDRTTRHRIPITSRFVSSRTRGSRSTVQIKEPGDELFSAPVELDYSYDEQREAVEETGLRALARGRDRRRSSLFARADAIEEAWRIVTPALERPPAIRVRARNMGTTGRGRSQRRRIARPKRRRLNHAKTCD